MRETKFHSCSYERKHYTTNDLTKWHTKDAWRSFEIALFPLAQTRSIHSRRRYQRQDWNGSLSTAFSIRLLSVCSSSRSEGLCEGLCERIEFTTQRSTSKSLNLPRCRGIFYHNLFLVLLRVRCDTLLPPERRFLGCSSAPARRGDFVFKVCNLFRLLALVTTAPVMNQSHALK